MNDISIYLSKLIYQFRLRNQLSLDGFAELSGLSRSLIYQIEKGRSVPTITALQKIAQAMGMGLQDVVAPLDHQKSVLKGNVKEIAPHTSKDQSFVSRPLHSLFEQRDTEFYQFSFIKKGHHQAVRPSGFTVCVFVEKGRLSLVEGGQTQRLGPGDLAELRPNRYYTYLQEARALASGYVLISGT